MADITKETRVDPLLGRSFSVELTRGHGKRIYSSPTVRRLAGRIAEVENLIAELVRDGGLSDSERKALRRRLFALVNQGPLRPGGK